MLLNEFIQSLDKAAPPAGITVYLQAMWQDAKGNWHEAHSLVDSMNDSTACYVHAYLHRKEGDLSNAAYWYSRAGKKKPEISLQEEWEQIVKQLL